MSTPFKMKGMNFKSSPMKQDIKEVKGTSIFGQSPKNFAKNLLINQVAPGAQQLYKKAKEAYNTYKGNKAVKESGVSKTASEAVIEGGKMGLKDSMKRMRKPGKMMDSYKKVERKLEKKRTMTDETKMKPPYKKPVGPIAN